MPPEPAPLFIGDADGLSDLLFRMAAVDKKSQPHCALSHRRIEDRLHVDPTLEKGVGQGDAPLRIANDQRHDRDTLAGAGRQPARARQFQEQHAALAQLPDAFGFDRHHAERREGGRRIGWRKADAEDKAGGAEFEIQNQRAGAGDMIAALEQLIREMRYPVACKIRSWPQTLLSQRSRRCGRRRAPPREK